jgi:prepilin-type N-terminal cleavage/methylation domain-containing protein
MLPVSHDARRRGFTLVEVIVVLVILAILAAIAIPALTGYIDKANDKDWEVSARNAVMAVRSVLVEAYGDGTLGKSHPEYINDGSYWSGAPSGRKQFSVRTISNYDTSDNDAYFKSAARLLGSEFPGPFTDYDDSSWSLFLFSPDDPSYNIMNAPAWYLSFRLGEEGGKVIMVLITYGINGAEPPTNVDMDDITNHIDANWTCDPNAGYRVFHALN